MTPEQHIALNSTLIQQVQLIVAAIGALLLMAIGYLSALLHSAIERIGRQGQKIDALANGEGETKMRGVIKQTIIEGVVQPGPAIPLSRPNTSKTRSTDTQPPPEGKEAI